MSASLPCPQCGNVYRCDNDLAGWITCAACGHVWNVDAQQHDHTAGDRQGTVAMPESAAASGKQRPPSLNDFDIPDLSAVPKLGLRGGQGKSGEYLPETGRAVRQISSAALTARVDDEDLHVREALEQRRKKGSEEIAREAAAPPAKQVHLDLFDEIEKQIDRDRAAQQTVQMPNFGTPPGGADATMPPPVARPAEAAGRRSTSAAEPPDPMAATPVRPDDMLGRTLGGCVIESKIGEGGMGSVYLATQLRLDRKVAIKVLPPEMKRNTKFLKRFEHEAKSLARINHPNILHVYDFGEDAATGVYFMVMEYIDGQDLAEILRIKRRLGQGRVLDILLQAVSGLEEAAANGVVHRDIKPDNLMFTKEGICKVSDFGLAKDAAAMTQVTNMGVRVGTPAFMSPEQCDGQVLDWRSDIYSLGVTAYVALTGSLPFSGESPFAIMLKHKSEEAPRVRAKVPGVDQRLDALVYRMMQKEPDRRASNFVSLKEEIDELLRSITGSAPLRPSSGGFNRMLHAGDGDDDGLPPLPEDLVVVGHAARGRAAEAREARGAPVGVSFPGAAADPALPQMADNLELAPLAQPQHPPSAEPLSETPPPARPDRRRPARAPAPAAAASDEGSVSRRGASRQRASKVFTLEEEGDRLAAQGRYGEAIAAWREAARVSSQWQIREALFKKIQGVQTRRRQASGAVLRMFLLTLLLAAAAGVYFGVVPLHGYLAQQDLDAALAIDELPERRAVLEAAILRWQQPPWWCEMLGHDDYTTPAVLEARTHLRSLEDELAARAAEAASRAAYAKLQAMLADERSGWDTIAAQLEQVDAGLTPAQRHEIDALRQQAESRSHEIAAGESAVAQALAAGEIEAAIAAAEALRKNGRLGAVGARLPRRLPYTLLDARGEQLPEVQLQIDGQVVKPLPPYLYTIEARPVVIQASAPGYVGFRRELVGQRDLPQLDIRLRRAIAWHSGVAAVGQAGWTRMQMVDMDHLFLHGEKALCLLALSDGSVRWRKTPSDLLPHAAGANWTRLGQQAAEGMILGTDQGDVITVKLDPDPANLAPQRLQRLAHPALDRLSYELRFVQGKHGSAVLLQQPEGFFVRIDAHVQPVTYGPLSGRLSQPLLFLRQWKVMLLDDQRLLIADEDGRLVGEERLSVVRRGPAAWGRGGECLGLACADGLATIDFHVAGKLYQLLPERWQPGEEATIVSLASAGSDLLVYDSQRRLHSLQWQRGAWQPRWTYRFEDATSRAVGFWVGADENPLLAVIDAAGPVRVLNRSSGALVLAYDHPRPVLAAAVSRSRLLIYDSDESLTAFELLHE